MANTKQHSLFLLIQSLDASEKAYFKKFAFKRDNKNNASFKALFDAVDKQDSFDLDALRVNKKINASHRTNIHAALNSLFKLLSQVLIQYRKEKGNNQKLFNLLAEFYLFKEKKLHSLAEKKYLQLEEFVEENKMYSFAPYVYQLRGSELQNNILTSREQLDKYFSKLDRSKRDLDINIDINKLSLKLEQVFHQNGGVVNKSKNNDKQADELLRYVNEIYERAAHSFLFSSVLANNRFVIQMIYGRLENLEDYINKYFQYFDKNIHQKIRDVELSDILITIKNYAVVSIYLNKQDIYEEALKRLSKILLKFSKPKWKEKLSFRIDHLNILNYAINEVKNKELNDMGTFLASMENKFKNKAQYSEAVLSCMMALVRLEKLDKALEISDEFIESYNNERIRDQYVSVRLLRSIVWFKKEVYELFESEITSTYRKLLKAKKFELQLNIVKELKKLNHNSSKETKRKIITKIMEDCDQVFKNDTGSKMMKSIELKAIAMLALA